MKPLSERDENLSYNIFLLHNHTPVGMKPLSERDENSIAEITLYSVCLRM